MHGDETLTPTTPATHCTHSDTGAPGTVTVVATVPSASVFRAYRTDRRPAQDLAPSQIVDACAAIAPYRDRGGLCDTLLRHPTGAFDAAVVGGTAGTGKTRLGLELLRRNAAIDLTQDSASTTPEDPRWKAAFLNGHHVTPEALARGLAELRSSDPTTPVLLILDTTETQHTVVGDALSACATVADDDAPLRLVLLVRDPATAPAIDSADVHVLDDMPLPREDRKALFRTAFQAFAAALRTDTAHDQPGPPDLDADAFAQPLAVVLAAYDAASRHAPSASTSAAALGYLTAPHDPPCPDGFGEHLVAHALGSDPGLLAQALSPERSTAGLRRTLLVLLRAQADHASVRGTLASAAGDRVLPDLVRGLPARDDAPADAAALHEALGALIDALRGHMSYAGVKNTLDALGAPTHPTVGVHLSLTANLVAAARSLAEADPGKGGPRLATALMSFAALLAGMGRRDDAIPPAHDAVNVYRELAHTDLSAHIAPFAAVLNNYATLLAGVGRRDEAIEPAGEAVALRRQLAQADPGAHRAGLANSLNNYATLLSGSGRREDAIEPAAEAVALRREFAQANPGANTASLATALNNYAIQLSDVGRGEDAIAPAREAVELRRELAGAQPSEYSAELAMSLNSYATLLSELGRHDEALAPAREAVEVRRGLARTNPEAFTPSFAMTLHNYANRLLAVGRRAEAVELVPEVRELRDHLREAPGGYDDLIAGLTSLLDDLTSP